MRVAFPLPLNPPRQRWRLWWKQLPRALLQALFLPGERGMRRRAARAAGGYRTRRALSGLRFDSSSLYQVHSVYRLFA